MKMEMVESGRREESGNINRFKVPTRVNSFWTGGTVVEKEEENVSRLW